MEIIGEEFDLDAYYARLKNARERVLLLDYDGTISPFHADPVRALPYRGIREALQAVAGVPGARIVIVSGRRLEDLRPALALLPHTDVWASHGWEWVRGGEAGRHLPSSGIRAALEAARVRADPLLAGGARVEIKVASVALHWRGLEQAEATRVRVAVTEAWEPLVDQGLALLPFDHGLEVRARGHDKGDAVRAAIASSGDDMVCAYLGDDFTDEDAFGAIRAHGLGVLVRDKPRKTLARLRLSPPDEVTEFLERWALAGRLPE